MQIGGDIMKKFIAIILSLVLALSVSLATVAQASDNECHCGYVPVIYVTGFAQTDLVANAGTPEEYQVFFPEAKAIITAVCRLILPSVMLAFTFDFSAFAKAISSAVNILFADVACDADGNPLNSTVDIEYRDEPRADHTAYTFSTFCYDWREDVFDIAAELNEYIEQTKELTGHDKVALRAESMGGAVAMTYLYVYGSDSVDTIVMQSSAYNGLSLIASLFTGDVDVKGPSAVNYICNFIEGGTADKALYRALVKSLGSIIINPICKIVDGVFGKIQDELYAECLIPSVAWIPGVWTFIPYEKYEDAKAYVLDNELNAKLIEKIDNYQYNVAAHTKELLDEAIDNGMKLCIVSHYGKSAVPANTYDSFQSDFLVDTKKTSFGATCAEFGLTLGDGYVQQVNDGHNHLSCDGIIDASTCAYPEQTWFIKDMMHTWYTMGYLKFVHDLCYCDEQPTVQTFSEYPQFLYNNQDTRELEPLDENNQDTNGTKVDFKELFTMIKDKISNK